MRLFVVILSFLTLLGTSTAHAASVKVKRAPASYSSKTLSASFNSTVSVSSVKCAVIDIKGGRIAGKLKQGKGKLLSPKKGRSFLVECGSLASSKSQRVTLYFTLKGAKKVTSNKLSLRAANPKPKRFASVDNEHSTVTVNLTGEHLEGTKYKCELASHVSGQIIGDPSSCSFKVKRVNHCVLDASFAYRIKRLSDNRSSTPAEATITWKKVEANEVLEYPRAPSNGAYVGLHFDPRVEGLASQLNGLGRDLAIGGFFLDIDDLSSFDALESFLTTLGDKRMIPLITITADQGLSAVDEFKMQDLACLIRTKKIPTFLRFAHEMNGDWYAWAQKPLKYIEAFRLVSTTIKQIAPNVAMVWAPNQGWGYPWTGAGRVTNSEQATLDTNKDGFFDDKDNPYMPYYPGDQYVDWFGISLFHFGTPEDLFQNHAPPPMQWFWANGYNNVYHNLHDIAQQRGKPMMLAETGAFFKDVPLTAGYSSEEEIKLGWARQIFNTKDNSMPLLSAAFPNYKAFVWLNVNKRERHASQIIKWKVTDNATVRNGFNALISDPYFISDPY